MDRNTVSNGINKSWAVLEGLGLHETFSNAGPLEVNSEFRDLVLSENSTYVEIFLAGLRLSHYNFLLTDYAYFQFSWAPNDNVRYAYYPNPYATGRSAGAFDFRRRRTLVEQGAITQEDYLAMLRDADAELRVPLIRYENAPSQYKGLKHPCSHLHIGHHGDNRWPLNRVLTPLAFTLWILKQYYGSEWAEFGDDDTDSFGNTFESKLVTEKMECRLVGPEYFTEVEARSFFVG